LASILLIPPTSGWRNLPNSDRKDRMLIAAAIPTVPWPI